MDKATKFILAMIAAGLWANIAIVLLKPARASPLSELTSIDQHLSAIYSGSCLNHKLC